MQKGLGDIGIVTTAIYGDKMKVMSVAYATPFTTNDPLLVAHTIDAVAEEFPGIKKTFASYNQAFLSAQVVLDSYQMFTRTEAKAIQDFKGMKIASAGFNQRYLAPAGASGVAGLHESRRQGVRPAARRSRTRRLRVTRSTSSASPGCAVSRRPR